MTPGATQAGSALTVVCFPHAGGGTARYRRWRDDLPDGVTLLLPGLPGRESRLFDDPLPDVAAASTYAMNQLAAELAGVDRLALVGISYGALVAFDLAARWEAAGNEVQALFVASQRAPTILPAQFDWLTMDDDRLVAELKAIGGWSPEMADEEFRELFLPVIRAELHASQTYLKPDAYPRLHCPIFAYHGTEDDTVRPAAARAWGEQTAHFRRRSLAAAHFLTGPDDTDLWYEVLREDLALVRDGRRGHDDRRTRVDRAASSRTRSRR